MKFNLFPKDDNFQDMFSRASKNVVEASKVFKGLVSQWNDIEAKIERIHYLEREGDLIRHELIDKLNHTFITPIDREDIYDLSSELDDIVDMIQATADRMQIYNFKLTDTEGMTRLAEIIEKSAVELNWAIDEMHDEKKKRRVLDHCIAINQLENDGDTQVKKMLKDLFDKSSTMPPVEVMVTKEVFEFMESIIDKCEDVACTVESIVVKNF